MPWEPSGRELATPARFDVFEQGLFFFAYAAGGGLEGHWFSREEPDLRPFKHHTAPPVTWHPLTKDGAPLPEDRCQPGPAKPHVCSTSR